MTEIVGLTGRALVDALERATPAVLFVTGKIKVKGDLAFAAGLIGYFDLPKPS